ncbi:MAG TPA: SDR family oxidoreductase [Candidatus Binatia bacterium]|jgi:short-subunit dehydrogenase|nr:SDR family oxidoreductase [Candidatus Binatia bacterium]
MNDWALITGATAGIGYELAKLFAADHFNLVLVARNEKRLNELAAELKHKHSIEIEVLPKDLAVPEAAREISEALRDTPISVLVNNAGFGSYGPFAETDLALQVGMVQVNVVALMQLTHLFLKPMLNRHNGRILNVASTAAFQPGPTMNVYYATKAFVYSFSYALSDELAGTGITVTTLCPGLTRTEFQARARLKPSGSWPAMEARTVAEIGYRGFMKGKRVVIPGLANQIASFFARRVPQRLTSAMVRRVHAHAG